MAVVGKLILKLGVEAGDLTALQNFESETKQTAQSADGAAKATDRQTRSTENLGRSAKRIWGDLNRLKWAIMGVAAATTAASKFGGMYAQSLHQFSANTGMSTEMLQKWQQQAALVGVSGEEMQDSLTGLQRTMTEIRMGMGGDIKAFQMLGLSTSASAEQILEALSVKLPGMDTAQGSLWASKLGLSEGMISMLRELKSLRGGTNQSLILDEAEIRRLRDFNMYFNRTWDNVKRMVQKVGALLSPVAAWVTWAFERFARAGMDITRWLSKAWEKLGPFKMVFVGMLAAALAYLFPIQTAIVAVGLALEDVASFMRGDNSIIGKMIAWFSDWNRVLKDTGMAIASLISALETLFGIDAFRYIFNYLTGMNVQGLGESMAAGIAAAPGGYDDVGMARMQNGKMVLDKNGKTTEYAVTSIVNINGGDLAKVRDEVKKSIGKATTRARQQIAAPEMGAP